MSGERRFDSFTSPTATPHARVLDRRSRRRSTPRLGRPREDRVQQAGAHRRGRGGGGRPDRGLLATARALRLPRPRSRQTVAVEDFEPEFRKDYTMTACLDRRSWRSSADRGPAREGSLRPVPTNRAREGNLTPPVARAWRAGRRPHIESQRVERWVRMGTEVRLPRDPGSPGEPLSAIEINRERPTLAIIVPCFNEFEALDSTLKTLPACLRDLEASELVSPKLRLLCRRRQSRRDLGPDRRGPPERSAARERGEARRQRRASERHAGGNAGGASAGRLRDHGRRRPPGRCRCHPRHAGRVSRGLRDRLRRSAPTDRPTLRSSGGRRSDSTR